jgi:H+/Cl- antiporter ClcA
MFGTAAAPRTPAARVPRWLIGLACAAALVVPTHAGLSDRVTSADQGRSGRSHADNAPAWALDFPGAARTETQDRRSSPGGTLPVTTMLVLALGACWMVRRAAEASRGKPRIAFRRRGPPFRRIAY